MKIQEAINRIDNMLDSKYHYAESLGYQLTNADFECLEMAKNALEKQLPKKPVNTRREIVCPTCRTLVGSSPYCRYCGQMLDHSEYPTEKGR